LIHYALECEKGHVFDSWFKNSAAYERQAARGLITCPFCGTAKVDRAIMAPSVAKSSRAARPSTVEPAGEREAPAVSESGTVAMVTPEEHELRNKLKDLRDHLIKNADYVGERFPEEARRMHYGEIERRSIYGEASRESAAALAEEGIEFHPLPRLPDERN
jgi:hypothetical protein